MEPHHHQEDFCYSASEMGSPFAIFTTFANSNHNQSAKFSALQTFEYVSQHTDIMFVRSHRENQFAIGDELLKARPRLTIKYRTIFVSRATRILKCCFVFQNILVIEDIFSISLRRKDLWW